MASIASGLGPLLHKTRAISGTLGFRPHAVALIKTYVESPNQAWDGAGTTRAQTSIPVVHAGGQAPKVRWLSQKDYLAGYPTDCELELTVTPGITLTIEQLQDTSEHTYFLITGPGFGANGTKFTRRHLNTESALSWKIGLKRISTSDKGTG